MGKTISNYLQLELIGQGSYGRVYKGKDQLTGEFVAIKVVSSHKLTSQKLIDNLDQEIEIMKNIKHPTIVNLIDVIRTKEETYLIMEYCKGGDFALFMKKKKRLSEDLAKFYLQQLASTLEFMRAKRLLHRDLKPSNILLTSNDEDRCQIKVADFGYARYIEPQDLAETACGTPLYMAPEVFTSQKYDAKVDLWSVGCILYEMVIGRVPFIAQTQVQLFEKIKTQPIVFPKEIPLTDECKDLLLKLLKRDPLERITFEEFFMHPFLDFDKYARPNPFDRQDTDEQNPDETEDEGKIKRVLEEAMNSLILSPSSDRESESNHTRFKASSAQNGSSELVPSGSGSLTRPKRNPYKDIRPAEPEEEYIIVNPVAVEVNAFADVLNRNSPTTGAPSKPQNPSIFQKSMLAESPPLSVGVQGGSPPFPSPSPSSSPSVGSALSRALATAATKLIWSMSSTTPEEQSARDILASLATLSHSASDEDEKVIWKNITTSARRAYVVVELANLKLANESVILSKQEASYQACILFFKALSIIRVAMAHARRFWQKKDQNITTAINQVVQFLRDKFNEYLEQAERLNSELMKTPYSEFLQTNRVHIDQAKLLFERARELGKEAGIEEVVGNVAISEKYYTKALLLFETLISKDLPESEILNASDRKIMETYASSTLKRLQLLQKRLPPSSDFS